MNPEPNASIKQLATSSKRPQFIPLSDNIISFSPIQRLSNQRTNRQLRRESQVSIEPRITPIWHQQAFSASPALQQRITQTPVIDAPTPVKQPVQAKPVPTKTNTTSHIEPVAQPVSAATSPPDTEQATTQATLPQPEKSKPMNAAPTPLSVEEQFAEQLKEIESRWKQQSGSPAPENHNLAETLTSLTQLREQIKEQESKLTELGKNKPGKLDLVTEQKTKEALINNLKHALVNTKKDLDELQSKPGADPALLTHLKEQLVAQKRKFDQLVHEKKQMEKKQTAPPPTAAPVKLQPAPVVKPAPAKTVSKPPITPTTQAVKHAPVPITTTPNAINGVVYGPDGKLITDAVVIVKNNDGRPLRALKTNILGQFWITTSLDSGTYQIETEKGDLRFDTMEVTLTGKPVQPLEIRAQ